MTHRCKRLIPITLQLCLSTQRNERDVYPLKSTESFIIYENTKLSVNGVEHQSLELENGLNDFQQESQCYINTFRGTAKPQDAQTEKMKLHRTERTSRCASDINPHCAFSSPNF